MARPIISAASAAAVLVAPLGAEAADREPAKVSRLGAYSGYSPVLFDDYVRTSQYVVVRDGTKIALDVFRPAQRGVPAGARLPVVWMNTPYDRRNFEGGETAKTYPGAALALVKYGYVVAIADMRGGYASFGKAVTRNRTEWMPYAYWDAYDITEWLAAQPWSSGKVGMWGCSATGHSQWQAAATKPPHLRAIMPLSAPSEYYDWGGISPPDVPSAQPYPVAVPERDRDATPVDSDRDGRLLAAAKDEHRYSTEPGPMPYRDSVSPNLAAHMGIAKYRYWLEVNTFPHMAAIGKAGIAVYQGANYGEDIRVKLGVFVKQRNTPGPIRAIIAPGDHCHWDSPYRHSGDNSFDITVEEHRWFDYWLKDIDNGITREPPIAYYTYNADRASAWRRAWQWPLPTERRKAFYLAPSRSLSADLPSRGAPGDRYQVDYAATRDTLQRKGMTYTSAPLALDTTMTGHPTLTLWIASSASDGDFVAYLFDIAPDGTAKPLPGTEDGRLRASHRAIGSPPYDNLGLPWHRSFASDVKPLTQGRPAELRFDMAPVSWIFRKGHRIRIALSNVAASRRGEGGLTPVLSPAPIVTYLRDRVHPSRVELPLSAPVVATASVRRDEAGIVATLRFPGSIDPRYLADVLPGSVAMGSIPALTVRSIGRSLIATFPRDARGTVTGRFGGRYDYGADATFVGRGAR